MSSKKNKATKTPQASQRARADIPVFNSKRTYQLTFTLEIGEPFIPVHLPLTCSGKSSPDRNIINSGVDCEKKEFYKDFPTFFKRLLANERVVTELYLHCLLCLLADIDIGFIVDENCRLEQPLQELREQEISEIIKPVIESLPPQERDFLLEKLQNRADEEFKENLFNHIVSGLGDIIVKKIDIQTGPVVCGQSWPSPYNPL